MDTPSPKLWWLVPARFLAIVYLMLYAIAAAVLGRPLLVALLPGAVLYLVSFAAPLAIRRDRARTASARGWRPPAWYYAMAVPIMPVSYLLSISYTMWRMQSVAD